MSIHTKAGELSFESKVIAGRLQDLRLAREFQNDSLYKSIFTKKDSLRRVIGHGGQVALALLEDKVIVGFAALDIPDPGERWAGIGGRAVLELKAVEIAPGFRHYGIARRLLSELMSASELEEKIVYLVSYRWIWDMGQTGLSVRAYRDVLIRLFSGFGFEESLTNEPNICLEDDNIFMVRMGKNVSEQLREDFKWVRFGLK